MNQNLIENNYIIVPNFISSTAAKELYKQFKTYCDEYDLKDDSQVADCLAKYDFIPFVELLVEKTTIVSELVGESVLPTYSYARKYLHGNVLHGHVDKPHCEISLTINLECDENWDIWIETPNGSVDFVSLNPGDAMLYLGTSARHGRNPFEGQECTQVFLHYVRSKGPFFKYYFDKDHHYSEEPIKNKKSIIIPTSETPISKYIKVYDSIFTEEECKIILDEYINSNEWRTAKVGDNASVNRNVRNCDTISISLEEVLSKNTDNRTKIDKMIFDKVDFAAKKYVSEFPECFIKTDSGYDLLRYEEGGYYSQHTDSFKEQPRSVSMSINLNNDYIGGNMAFFNREMQIRGGTGSIIMFPSNFMYPHEIMPIEKGTRYSIVTWLT